MKFVLTMVLLSILAGCAGVGVWRDSSNLGFVKASQGKAKGVYSWFSGSGNYCMLEMHNVSGVVVDRVAYTDGTCKIWWRTKDGDPLETLTPDPVSAGT